MVPLPPTTHPICGDTKERPYIEAAVPMPCGVQVAPPSAVCRIVPFAPMIHPRFSSVKNTPVNCAGVPLGSFFHLWPPSIVLSTVPPEPTAHPRLASRKNTLMSVTSVPVFWEVVLRVDSAAAGEKRTYTSARHATVKRATRAVMEISPCALRGSELGLVVRATFGSRLKKALVGHALGFNGERSGLERQPFLRRTACAVGKQIPGTASNHQRAGREIGVELSRLADAEQVAM